MIKVIAETIKRDMSYNRDRSRDRDNRGRSSRNRRNSGSRNSYRSMFRDKSEERCYYCREPEYVIQGCQKRKRNKVNMENKEHKSKK